MGTAPIRRAAILIADDEKVVRESLRHAFRDDHELLTAATGRQALRHMRQHTIDLVFLDIRLPDMNGIDLLKEIKQIAPAAQVIMMTAVQTIEAAVDAMKNGAFNFLAKPLDFRRVKILTRQALALKNEHTRMSTEKHIRSKAGGDASAGRILKVIESLLPYEGHVLIEGPNGSGKQQIARALHSRGSHGTGPFRAVNCASMPARQIEQVLCGLDRKASSGSEKIGHAPCGSLFLNNISYLTLDLQGRLLRLITQQGCERPRSAGPAGAELRIIAATTQNLKTLVDARLFRKDLYARLSTLPLSLPLLRAKGEYIGRLLEHFRKHHARGSDARRQGLAPDARSAPTPSDWPNSVREFEHLVARLCCLQGGRACHTADFADRPLPDDPDAFNGFDLKAATRTFERQYIISVLQAVKGSRSRAARCLGIHRNTLLLKTKELGIDFH